MLRRYLHELGRRRVSMLFLGSVAIISLCTAASSATADEPITIVPESVHEVSLGAYAFAFTFGPEEGIWYMGNGSGRTLYRVTKAGIPTGNFPLKWGEKLGYSEEPGSILDFATGTDGALWYVANGWEPTSIELLGRMTTTGEVTAEFLVGEVNGLAGGPGARIWFTEGNGVIKRVVGSGSVEEFTVPTGVGKDLPSYSSPGALVAGPDGNMWFLDYGLNDEDHDFVGRITPQGEIKEFPLPGEFREPQYQEWIAAGPGGDVWVATSTGLLYEVSPDGVVEQSTLPRVEGEIEGIAAGPEGDLWYTSGAVFGGTTLGRVTPAGDTTLFQSQSASTGWDDPTLGPDGNLWFIDDEDLVSVKPPLAPVLVSQPAIGGEPIEGTDITVAPGEWQNAPTLNKQWLLCDTSGASCEQLLGQTGNAVEVLPSDVGHTFRVVVTGSGPGGSLSSTSAPSLLARSALSAPPLPRDGELASISELAPTLNATMTWRFGWAPSGTRIRLLRLHSLASETEVEVRCHGKGCPFRSQRIRPLPRAATRKCKVGMCLSAQGGELELAGLWRGRRLRTGDVVEVVVAHSGYRGKLFVYIMRRGGPPSPPVIRCLTPGSADTTQQC